MWAMVQHYTIGQMRRTRRAWEVTLLPEGGGAGRMLSFHPFVYLAPEHDTVELSLDPAGAVAAVAKLMRPEPGAAPERVELYPYYARSERIDLAPGFSMPVLFSEVTTPAEFEQLKFLDQFHYLQAKPAWGRQAYLIARPAVPAVMGTPLPAVLGAVVLASPSLLSSVRSRVLGWNDRQEQSREIDRVVRIARVVVHPEFRGLGIGARLTAHAVQYCRERWNVKGKAAWAVETVAEMSRHHPVFAHAGLTYVGETNRQDVAHFYDTESRSLGTEQGAGQIMASLRRFRQQVHAPKPVWMMGFRAPWDERVRLAGALVGAGFPVRGRVEPGPIVLRGVTLEHAPGGVWELSGAVASPGGAELEQHVGRLAGMVGGLRADGVAGAVGGLAAALRDTAAVLGLASERWRAALAEGRARLAEVTAQREAVGGALERLVTEVEAELRALTGAGGSRAQIARRKALNERRLQLLDLGEQLKLGSVSAKQAWVQEAFGVAPGQVTRVAGGLNLEIMPGQIVLVVGPSGSGKSTLLGALKGDVKPAAGTIAAADVAFLDLDFDPAVPLIDLVEAELGEAVYLLNTVGLAESHLYLKRRDELSHGQRYRAAFARLLSRRQPIWLADEFCAFLDPVTTVALCRGVRRLVKERGITLIAAAARGDYLMEALQPDLVVEMNAGGQVQPNPQEHYWPTLPPWPVVRTALLGEPEGMPRPLALWLRKVGLLTESDQPERADGWTETALRLRSLPEEAQLRALCRHLWAVDWYCHRMQNWVDTYGAPPAQGWEAYLGVPPGQAQSRWQLLSAVE